MIHILVMVCIKSMTDIAKAQIKENQQRDNHKALLASIDKVMSEKTKDDEN